MIDWPLELAENANTYTPLGRDEMRIVNDHYVLWMGRGDHPSWNVAQRFRLERSAIEQTVEEVREQVRMRGRSSATWEIGTHATPPDLVERLLELGLVDDEPTSLAVGMVLTEPPDRPPADIVVRRVGTAEERLTSARIAARAFGGPEPAEAPLPTADPNNVEYVAYVDGQPVARASASFGEYGVTLFGGGTLPEARGRGAYRALVAARWDDAVARGTPLVVTQAGPLSRPILARLGLREVCEIRILLDRFRAESTA